jgi:hypothetical protein
LLSPLFEYLKNAGKLSSDGCSRSRGFWFKVSLGREFARPISTNSWVQWLTPIILAIWEAEIGRTAVPGQSRQKRSQVPISMEKTWAWWYVLIIPASIT